MDGTRVHFYLNYMMLEMFALLIKNHDFNKKTSQVHPRVNMFFKYLNKSSNFYNKKYSQKYISLSTSTLRCCNLTV